MAAENPFAQVDLGDVDTTAQAVSAENGTAGVATNGKQGGIDQGKAEPGAAFEPLEIELEETTGDGACATACIGSVSGPGGCRPCHRRVSAAVPVLRTACKHTKL